MENEMIARSGVGMFNDCRPMPWRLGMLMLVAMCAQFAQARIVVADAKTRAPLSGVSVFDRDGRFAGISRRNGSVTCVSGSDFPVTLRCLGYEERLVGDERSDTIFLHETLLALPEVTVSGRNNVLHLLAYAREYSSLTTYTDTVTMFREKMVDFMLPDNSKSGFKGWRYPRVINSKSYYRFTNAAGLDSVSDRCNHHFTWSDWIGILPEFDMRPRIAAAEAGSDTVASRYSPAEIWVRTGSRLMIDVDVLADTAGYRWVPGMVHFLRKDDIGFDRFNLHLSCDNVAGGSVMPGDIAGFSFNIESRGRGHNMFMFNRRDEPFFVTMYTEVYILDKEYITIGEAKKWERNLPAAGDMGIYRAPDAPPLQQPIVELMARVGNINHEEARLSIDPDNRLAGRDLHAGHDFGKEVVKRLKGLFGIDHLRANRKHKRQWRDFRRSRMNRSR